MPRLTSITSQALLGISTRFIPLEVVGYNSLTLNGTTYNEGDTVTATLTATGIPNGTTVAYTVTGVSANDLSAGTLTGLFTLNNGAATVTWTLAQDGLTEGTDNFILALAALDSLSNTTGALTDTATVLDTSNDPLNVLWLGNGLTPVTVRSIISDVSMQINGVFAVNPSVPRTIQGRTSGAITTITAVTANNGTFFEVDDNGNSTSFVVGEDLNLVPLPEPTLLYTQDFPASNAWRTQTLGSPPDGLEDTEDDPGLTAALQSALAGDIFRVTLLDSVQGTNPFYGTEYDFTYAGTTRTVFAGNTYELVEEIDNAIPNYAEISNFQLLRIIV
tara:strand:- start:417 stop:1412 length:996 start_codon:yes stop_codon:yes gene_type:complete